ncbi:hypothetical protein ACIPIU_11370 [Streptomyces massasporeus]|uniref:hypothetical protein n=1 Tax=Streptomyces massasporeus TaxID=67324 RepID=UPI00380EFFE5
MTRNVPDPPEALVRKHLQEVLDTCRETKRQPSVLMLARRLELTNTTFRRRYPDIAREIADHRAAPPPLEAARPHTADSSPATRSSDDATAS